MGALVSVRTSPYARILGKGAGLDRGTFGGSALEQSSLPSVLSSPESAVPVSLMTMSGFASIMGPSA
jgi:hypothetical protein